MRNVFCPKYSACLSKAAKNNDSDFDCTGCKHQREVADLPSADTEGDILLLWAIFKPDLYRAACEAERAVACLPNSTRNS